MITIRKTMLAASGCEKEGPVEKAGKEVDKAGAQAGQQIEKAGDAIKDAAQGEKK